MPGVQVLTTQRPAPSDRNPDPDGRYFVAGLTERGPSDVAVKVTSMSDYTDKFGDRVSYGSVYDDLSMFFGEGGGEAYVARVVGPAPVKATLTLNDRAGSPLATVRIDALGGGVWGTRLTVAVTNGIVANTYVITVYLDGIQVDQTPPLTSPAAAVTALANSNYVRAVNLASATAAPSNNPAALTATALAGSPTDDRASVTDTHRVTALALFTPDLGSGAVAVPGSSSSTVQQGLIAHGSLNNRVALLAGAQGASTGTVTSAATALRSVSGAECAGFFYPWVQISDGAGGTRTVSPEGFVAGRRAYTARTAGVWQPAAGVTYGRAARTVIGVEAKLQQSTIDSLADTSVNSIVEKVGVPTIYGWRSLSADRTSFSLLSIRDLLNSLVVEGTSRLEAFLFHPINVALQDSIENELRSMVQPIAAAGGIVPYIDDSGQQVDPGYSADAGPALNPPSLQQANTVKAALSVRPAGSAETIVLQLTKAAAGVPF